MKNVKVFSKGIFIGTINTIIAIPIAIVNIIIRPQYEVLLATNILTIAISHVIANKIIERRKKRKEMKKLIS